MKKKLLVLMLLVLFPLPHLRANEDCIALPVTQTWIPKQVFNILTGIYMPRGLYDIAMIKCPGGDVGYVIRLIRDNRASRLTVDATGKPVQSPAQAAMQRK